MGSVITGERRFRFGLYADKSRSARDLRDLSRRAESLGFSTFLLGDHFSGQLAPFSMLATAAAVTTQLRIGSLVFCNEFRHPAVLAKECATLDVLSEGRLEVGIGAGWNAAEFVAMGVPFRSARARVARVEEAVDILRGLWGNDTFSYSGEHYKVSNARVDPKPLQLPHPPILLPGGGRRMIALAARNAAIIDVTAGFADAAQVAKRVAELEQLAGGRRSPPERCMLLRAARPGSPQSTAEGLARELGWTPEQVRDAPCVLAGSATAMADQLQERRDRYGITYVVVPEHDLPAFGPVATRLAGT